MEIFINKLAINRGDPVRKDKFPPIALGASLIGVEELVTVESDISRKKFRKNYNHQA